MSLEDRARGTVFVDSLGSGAIRLGSITDEDVAGLELAAREVERIIFDNGTARRGHPPSEGEANGRR